MISRLYMDHGYEGIIIEEGDSIVQYLHHVSKLRKLISMGRYERIRGDKIYRSTLAAEYDMSEKLGIVVIKIKRIFVIRMVQINKKEDNV